MKTSIPANTQKLTEQTFSLENFGNCKLQSIDRIHFKIRMNDNLR